MVSDGEAGSAALVVAGVATPPAAGDVATLVVAAPATVAAPPAVVAVPPVAALPMARDFELSSVNEGVLVLDSVSSELCSFRSEASRVSLLAPHADIPTAPTQAAPNSASTRE